MKPSRFDYRRASSIEECLELLAEHGEEAKLLAGGQSLVPLLAMRLSAPAMLIDINGIGELSSLQNGAGLTIGATVRHRAIERDPLVRSANPLLADASRLIGHGAIRTRGTVGGSVAHADPAAELPTVFTLLDASVEVKSTRGARTVQIRDLFLGFLTTALEPDELLTAVHVPAFAPGAGWSIREVSRRSGDFAIVGAAAVVRLDSEDRVAEARLCYSGVADRPRRAVGIEEELVGQVPNEATFAEAALAAASELQPPNDLHGTAGYRRHLAAVLGEQALIDATSRARGES